MAKSITIQYGYGANFDYNGVNYSLSVFRWNPYTYCWITDLTVDGKFTRGVTIRGGLNILRQYNTGINIYVLNTRDVLLDPIDFDTIYLVILESTDIQEAFSTSGLEDIAENST